MSAPKRHRMLTDVELAHLADIDYLLDEANAHSLARDGHCKSSDGHVSVSFGTHWDRDPEESRRPVTVEIYSYLLGPHRNHSFDSTAQALEVVKAWHKREMSYDDERDVYTDESPDPYLAIEADRDRKTREFFDRMDAVSASQDAGMA